MLRQRILHVFTMLLVVMSISIVQAGTYTSDFNQYLAANQSNDQISAVITLADRVNLEALKSNLSAHKANRQEWHETVIRAMQEKATESQADILARLNELEKQGLVSSYENLWLGNIIIITATKEALDEMVARTDIGQIAPDYEIESIKDKIQNDVPTITSGIESGLTAIRADEVWAMGYTGEGRLVSHIDTGVDGEHVAVADRWRGLDSRYDNNPGWAWYDPVTETTFPFDSDYHGTHTMGTICGLGEANGDTIGVAYDAEWISAAVIDRDESGDRISDMLNALQWVADPDSDPSTAWDVPDVCSNSWGITSGYDPCDATFWDAIDAAEAAGIVVLFAAGNEGESGAETLRIPADRATTDINAFAIGAVNGAVDGYPIADFSSRGPSYCTDDGTAAIKPEICAPGVSVRSAYAGGDYITMGGTSMATPHVAGVVALMREANPDISSDEIKQILLETAVDLGDEGNDNTYGMGMLDAYEAVQHALAMRQDLGVLAGTITDSYTGNPVEGVTVSVVDRTWQATSSSDGSYYLFMPADTLYEIEIYSSEYQPVYDSRSVAAGETTMVDYSLEPKVKVTFSVSFGNGDDISYRNFYIKGSWDNYGYYDESWSGDLIAIADDGQSPDEIAEDGIYTASILLARDLDNDYSWAVYTEDYGVNGIDDALLANGDDFEIDSFDPIIVPELAPNPSGSNNNFVFSVEGDNGLSTDLEPYVNGVPYKWGASAYLTGNVTYSFGFYVMHGNEPVYGDGGVGGDLLTFTPSEDGAYDFVFNDDDDSYAIQLSETNGAPLVLEAIGGEEHHIPVAWVPPGVSSSTEMAYDDGVADGAWYSYYSYVLFGVMFVPESYPVLLDSVMITVATEGFDGWPWPDETHDPVGVSVFLDDGTGYPQDDPVFSTVETCELGEQIRVDVSGIVITSGNFWVCFNNTNDGGYDGLNRDYQTDYPANQWYRTDEFNSWTIGSPFGGDNMIRAKVYSNDVSTWLAYDDGIPAHNVSAAEFKGDLSATFASTNFSSTAESMSSGLAYHPHILSDPPVTTETETIYGYNLYRSTTSGPYDQGTKINDSPIPSIYYDDWGDDAYGPIVNGVTYFYEVSALYNIGGETVEVGPSMEDTAVALNQPPDAPQNLTGESNGYTVTLNWDANTDYDIASYNIYRRNPGEDVFNLVGTVNHPSATFTEDVTVDGIYRYRIKAEDAQGLESNDFSNSVDVGVGLIPPGEIIAYNDLEFQIKTKWRTTGNSIPGLLNVAVINSKEYDIENGVMEYLIESGLVSDFDAFECEDTYPSLSDLEPYDMVMIWSTHKFGEPDSLGDVLADFVDLGKPAIVFNNSFYDYRALGGRFMDDYCVFIPTNEGSFESQPPELGEYDEDSPIMNGITSLSASCFYVSTHNDPEVVAYWENGYPAVAFSSNYSIICVNMSLEMFGVYTIGDYMQLVYNCVDYAANLCGADPDAYNLYRADSESGPFELVSTVDGDIREYVDSSITANAVSYYYQVKAVWDGEETEPSNVAEGMGQNYVPEAPGYLTVAIDDYEVSLDWAFTNLMGDLDHYNIYRRTQDNSLWVLIGNSSDTTYVDNLSEDNIYEYCVTAVDNGDPQLESDISNIVKAGVGNLPPQELTAESNQDGVVPLTWYEPDYLPTTVLSYDDGVAANGYYFNTDDYFVAKQFVATAPVEICSLYVHIITEGDDLWPWPDSYHAPVEVKVWNDNGSGQPGSVLYETSVSCPSGEWLKIGFNTPVTCTTDNFWISCNTGTHEAVAIDAASDSPEYDWTYQGSWVQGAIYDGDHMIRAAIAIDDDVELLTEDNPISGKLTLQKSSSADNTPELCDTEEMLGYYIFRNTTEDVPVDDDYRITSSYVTETSYDDEEVENGTTYYYVAVAVYDNDGTVEYSITSNETSATPMVAGQLAADSTSITAAADTCDEAIIVPLTLTNDGGLPVTYKVNVTADNSVIAVNSGVHYTVDGKFTATTPTLNNTDNNGEDNETPVVTDNGGPDGFGYYWVDSDEAGGPEYNWVDITGIGQQITAINNDNTSTGPFYMDFDFPFYGNTYSYFGVSGYGWLAFISSFEGRENVSLPSTEAPYTIVAPCWCGEIYVGSETEYYYYCTEDSTVVSWIGVYTYSDDEYDFQVILTPDGVITFQYQQIESDYAEYYTTGIQNIDGSDGLCVCYNSDCFDNQSAVMIKPGWLRVDPYTSVVEAGASLTLDVILDPGNVDDDGNYYGILELSSYDMNHDLDPIEIPVTFAVGDTTGIDDGYTALPTVYSLDQNYPNPFNAKTEIKYGLPSDSDVKLDVYNVLGQKVVTLVDQKQQAGYYSIIWDGTNESGQVVSSGIYFYNLTTSGGTLNKSMVLLK